MDASVLYAEPVRSALLWVAALGGFEPLWTERILGEVEHNLIDAQKVSPRQWERLQAAMNAAFPTAMLDQGAANAIERRMPNDPKDRHVLAAAVAHDAGLVVTNNLKHFKRADLARFGVRALSADQLLCELLSAAPNLVCGALERQAGAMSAPRQWTIAQLLGCLAGLGPGDALAPVFAAKASDRLGVVTSVPPQRS
ncbi:MAG TPA: PIN domain-containing protein [Solirubrobacteraceae bacterium]|nr:PIN domain-containing protein [Solirubrobacteraceae bacterium]